MIPPDAAAILARLNNVDKKKLNIIVAMAYENMKAKIRLRSV